MALQNPFSFTDDSVMVQLPPEDASVASTEQASGVTKPTSTAMAMHLFRLRKLQSAWYQEEYLSGNTQFSDAEVDAFIGEHMSRLSRWYEAIPTIISASAKVSLLLEYHYICTYLSLPSPRIPHSCATSMQQVLEHSSAYATLFHSVFTKQQYNRVVCTYHDALRTHFVGKTLLAIFVYRREEIEVSEGILLSIKETVSTIGFILSRMSLRWPEVRGLRDGLLGDADYLVGSNG